MKIGVLCIGDELLKGAVINTNLGYMGSKLLQEGIYPAMALEVPDRSEDVVNALKILMKETDFVLVSGGLGPTSDDLTKPAVAEFLGRKLYRNSEAVKAITDRWASMRRGSDLPLHFLSQADIPEGAVLIPNHYGTAPGIYLELGEKDPFPGKYIVMMPGPPSELEPMFEHQVMPLVKKALDSKLYSFLFHIAGVGESRVEERMQNILAAFPAISVAYCAAPEFVKLFITSECEKSVESAKESIRKEFEKELLSDKAKTVAEEVIFLMKEKNHTLSLAESCTGGMISQLITNVPGASEVYEGGIVSYANSVKENLLKVKSSTLAEHGAVSSECASEMLEGLKKAFGTSCGISVTGIAGPGGGTEEKPVGLVYIGVYCRENFHVGRYLFRGSRDQIRARSAAVGLNILRCMLKGIDVKHAGSIFLCPRS